MHDADPYFVGRAETEGNLLFTVLVGLGLLAAEAFPLYGLAMETIEATPPTFDPASFAATVLLSGIGDLFLLFLVHTWTETE